MKNRKKRLYYRICEGNRENYYHVKDFIETFAKRLVYLREEKNLAGTEVAARAKIRYRTYNNYENGTFPPLERLIAIVHALDITFDDLFQPFLKHEGRDMQDILRKIRVLGQEEDIYRDIKRVIKFLEQEKENSGQGEAGGETVSSA